MAKNKQNKSKVGKKIKTHKRGRAVHRADNPMRNLTKREKRRLK